MPREVERAGKTLVTGTDDRDRMIFTLFLLMISSVLKVASELPICELCQCQNATSLIDCSERMLTKIPTDIPTTTKVLYLNNNNISTIPDFIFNDTVLRIIDLSNNVIVNLKNDSFSVLQTLHVLYLQHNYIVMGDIGYPIGVFKHLTNLRYLDISSNLIMVHPSYPGHVFNDLISLEQLKMDGLPDIVLGDDFSKLKKLTSLNLTGNCKTENIVNSSFKNVQNLQRLILSKCDLQNIEFSALSVFKDLVFLDLSYNRKLGFDKAFISMQLLKSLKFSILDLTAIVNIFAVGISLTQQHLKKITHLRITHLYLDSNRIEYIETDAMSYIPSSIQILSFRDNRPTFGYYLLRMNVFQHLIYIDASQQYTSHTPFNSFDQTYSISRSNKIFHEEKLQHNGSVFSETRSTNEDISQASIETHSVVENAMSNVEIMVNTNRTAFTSPFDKMLVLSLIGVKNDGFMHIPIPPMVQYINVSRNKLGYPIPKLHFTTNKVKSLDLSVNIFHKWEGPITGVCSLEWLDLSNNYCDFISDVFFNAMPNLSFLDISSNFLGAIVEGDVQGHLFWNLSKLQTLDLSDNKLRYIPSSLLHGQTNLRKLVMSRNPLRKWTINIDHMHDLEHIDISENLLSSLPQEFRTFCDKQYEDNKRVTVDLQGQPLQCTCDQIEFLIWMNTNTTHFINRAQYYCLNTKSEKLSLVNLEEIIMNLQRQCTSYTILIIILICGFIFMAILVIVSVVYRYRWKLRYLYFLTRSKYRGYSAIGVDTQNRFDFDGFVSYADEDRSLVVQDMVTKLEDEQGTKLCIHHRDFLVGEEIAANILNAVRNSRKTLILLSRNFLASYWCTYELNMAHIESLETGRNVLIVIIYEHIPVNELPEILVQLMRNDSYIEYTEDTDGNVVFWDNLLRAISAD